MIHGSLFSGIGGFDLAAEWMGWENAFHCEIDPFCQRVLKYYWPHATSYRNIDETDFTPWRGKIDILSGGFPCQSFSKMGLQLGSADPRHKWPQNFRAIREIRPRWYVGENVRQLVNWDNGVVFEKICVDLEAEGYEVQSFILPAAGVGADHQRERVWFVAHSNEERQQKHNLTPITTQKAQRYIRHHTQRPVDIRATCWDGSVSALLREANGIPERLVANERNSGIGALGNAIVPQVAYEIFNVIDTYELLYG